MKIRFSIEIEEKNFDTIKRTEIKNDKDHVRIGIYYPKVFKENYYIVCCHRVSSGLMLDYTYFCHGIEQAENRFLQTIDEVKEDME